MESDQTHLIDYIEDKAEIWKYDRMNFYSYICLIDQWFCFCQVAWKKFCMFWWKQFWSKKYSSITTTELRLTKVDVAKSSN